MCYRSIITAIFALIREVNYNVFSTGICDGTEDGLILAGTVVAVLNIGPCAGTNVTFDGFTGFNSPTSFTLEELPLRKN